MKNCIDLRLDMSKDSGAKIFPGAARGSPREVTKTQQGQIQSNKTSFDRETDAHSECHYPLAVIISPRSRNPKSSGKY